MLSQEQFADYKKYYEFSLELFNNNQKLENNVSMMLPTKPINKDFPAYNNYFEPRPKDKTKKHDKDHKNSSKVGRESKENDIMSRSGQTQTSFVSNSVNKRVGSAKSKQ